MSLQWLYREVLYREVVFDKCYTGARRIPGKLSGVGQIIQSKFQESGNYMGALAMRQCEFSQGSKYKT
jgi:hypothetical protein